MPLLPCRRVACIVPMLILVGLTSLSDASAQPTPVVLWESASWVPSTPYGQIQTQDASGEDWYFSVERLTSLGPGGRPRLIGAGYHTIPNGPAPSCMSDCGARGCSRAIAAEYSSDGDNKGRMFSDLEGAYWRVAATSDGGFVAAGYTHSRADLIYNPTALNPSGVTLSCWPAPASDPDSSYVGRQRVAFVAKYRANGSLAWQYAYGLMNDPNVHMSGGSGAVQRYHDQAWDAVERPDGGFRIVGWGVDPATNYHNGMVARAFVIDVDADGMLLGRRAYGNEYWKSYFMGIERVGDEYYAVGTQYFGSYETGSSVVYVARLGSGIAPPATAERQISAAVPLPDARTTGFDVAIAGNGAVHVAAVMNCRLKGRCFEAGAGGTGEAVVYQLDAATLATLSSTGTALGVVKAYDLMIRLQPLGGGDVALVSTKQPNGPTGNGPPGQGGANCALEPNDNRCFDNTDAFFARLAPDGTVRWQGTYASRTSRVHESGYVKYQECLYDIAEDGGGQLYVSGNNSSNLDDNLLLRISQTVPGLTEVIDQEPFDISGQHLVLMAPSPRTVSFAGNASVQPNSVLELDGPLRLAFGPGRRLITAGTLVGSGTTLTASQATQGWLGVRYNTGSGGSLTNVTVERVGQPPAQGLAPWVGSAITITDASPVLTNVRVRFPASPWSGGVAVSGAAAAPVITELEALSLTGNAVTVTGGARADLVRGQLLDNSGGVVASGVNVSEQDVPQTRVYLIPAPGAGGTVGPVITGNTGGGVSATSSAEVRFGAATGSHGLTTVTSNDGQGLAASSGGVLYAGTATTFQQNVFFQNGGSNLVTGNVIAWGAGSRAYVDCNWWGTATPGAADFRAGATGGGLLTLTRFLTANPLQVSNPPCVMISSPTERSAGGTTFATAAPSALRRDSLLTARLLAAVEAPPAEAFAALAALVADAPASEEAAAAVGEMGGLAGRHGAPAGVDAALGALAAHAEAALRIAAWQALVVGRAAEGDAAGALAAADALAAEGAVVAAEAARVSLYAAAADTTAALAALERLEAAAPASIEAFVARASLGLGPDPFGSGQRGLAPETQKMSGALVSSPLAGLTLWPNPASGSAVVTLTLASAADVRVTVHDLLGRTVATLTSGTLQVGTHRADVPVGALAPGVYVVRAVVGGAVQTSRLTVAR